MAETCSEKEREIINGLHYGGKYCVNEELFCPCLVAVREAFVSLPRYNAYIGHSYIPVVTQ
jgi:hypothetical protein